MKNKFKILAFVLFAFIFSGCEYGLEQGFYRKYPVNVRANTMKTLKLANELGYSFNSSESEYVYKEERYKDAISKIRLSDYRIMLISDIHIGIDKFGNEDENIKSFLEKVSSLSGNQKPAFCFSLGDLADHGKESEFQKYQTQIVEKLDEMGIKTFNLLGNHDLYNTGWLNYKKICYPYTSFYKLENDIDVSTSLSFYALDSASASLGGETNSQQMIKFKTAIGKDTSTYKIVFTHVPVYASQKDYFIFQNTVERNTLISVLASNNCVGLYDGHTHERHTSEIGFVEENIGALFKDKKFYVLHIEGGDIFGKPTVTIEEISF